MALTPLFVLLQRRLTPAAALWLDCVEEASGQTGSDLIIGFGRFGQVASQSLLARDVAVTIIDNDIEMMQSAEELGFKIYYGDGTRLDVLHASGAHSARAIAVCVDNSGGGQSHRRTGNARVSACQAASAFLRWPAFAAFGGCGRGLPDPRDLRVGGDLRQGRAGGTGDGRGRSRHDFAPYPSARRRAFRIGDRCRRCTRRSRADVRQHVASRAPAHTVHAAASR
ncbi:NAD-binding protein [Xanthomonas oryzae]|uniref:NAD-binding protein n=1 Tax=Xanthomonas oryzae TaxID=347 RepID=UPI003CCF17CA